MNYGDIFIGLCLLMAGVLFTGGVWYFIKYRRWWA